MYAYRGMSAPRGIELTVVGSSNWMAFQLKPSISNV